MSPTKIQLSEEESVLVRNAGWILTKNGIIQKVCNLFGILAGQMKEEWEGDEYLCAFSKSRAKISKGENFQGLPYVVLDYPREYEKENVLAIRCLFWWGNYFSISLHLKGRFKQQFSAAIKKNTSQLAGNHFLVCISEDEWSHALIPEQYIPLAGIPEKYWDGLLTEKSFLRIVSKIDLELWDRAEHEFLDHFRIILKSLRN